MLHIENLVYRIAGRPIFDGASVHVPAGHKVGLVGRNGTGKTTLLRLIDAEIHPDAGDIRLAKRARIDRVSQEAPGGPMTPLDYVLGRDEERAALLARAETATDADDIAEIHTRLADIAAHSAPARAARILAGLGFTDEEQQRPLSSFSGGWRMRASLAGVLFSEPDLLLLDEPTNYLDFESAMWLESYLRRYPKTVLLVSHDRDLLNRAVDSILHLDQLGLTFYRGGYDAFEAKRREQQRLQSKLQEKQEAQRKHMQAFVDRFRYKASKARQAQSRLKALDKMKPIAAAVDDPTVSFNFPAPEELRPPILVAENASVGYTADAPVLRDLDFRLDPDDRIAVLGRNGNGKTTLARLIAGRLQAGDGELRRGAKLQIGYFGQHQIEELDPDRTAFEQLVSIMPKAAPTLVRSRLGGFGLTQDKANVNVADLSGGERARLVLAAITAQAPQLLILDEPTNHLDVDAREALIHALNDFSGAVIVISHDRHFVELVADQLWLVEGGSMQVWDDDIDAYRRRLLGGEAGGDAPAANDRPVNAKARRQAKAAARAQIAPLRKAVATAEKDIAKLNEARDRLDANLANPTLYDDDPERLTQLNRERAEIESRIAAAEEAWLAATDALEAATAGS